MNFQAILKTALGLTLNHPVLWVLGLFLSGGFNTAYFYFPALINQTGWMDHVQYRDWINQPLFVWAVLLLLLAGIIFVNAVKTVFVLHSASLLEISRIRFASSKDSQGLEEKSFASAFFKIRHYLSRVVAMSVFTVVISVLATAALAGPLLRLPYLQDQVGLVLLAFLLFWIIIVVTSCLNIFATFFIILFDQSVNTALAGAVDLLRMRWLTILNFLLVLMALYFSFLFIGGMVIRAALGLSFAAGYLAFPFSIFTGPAIIQATGALSVIVLWIWIGVVHVFFNAALLVLFSKLIAPTQHVTAEESLQPVPPQ